MYRAPFPKSQRLNSNNQFREVIRNRLFTGNSDLIIYARPNSLKVSRIGISVGKGSGPAVVRNRLKRLIREAFRCNQAKVPAGLDLVVTPSRELAAELKNAPGAAAAVKLLSQNRINVSFTTLISRLREKTAGR